VLTDKVVHMPPAALMGDRGYGFPWLIALVLLLGIRSLLSPRGKDKPHGSGLGGTTRRDRADHELVAALPPHPRLSRSHGGAFASVP
jgi:hypothetical protein